MLAIKKGHVIIVMFKVETIIQNETNFIFFLYLFCENSSTAERETHDGQTNTFRSNKLIFSGVPYIHLVCLIFSVA